jgi:hypothetical protein
MPLLQRRRRHDHHRRHHHRRYCISYINYISNISYIIFIGFGCSNAAARAVGQHQPDKPEAAIARYWSG